MTRIEEQRRVVRILEREVSRLDDATLLLGETWYPDALAACMAGSDWARARGNGIVTVDRYAGAVAVLSPMQKWTVNLAITRELAVNKYASPQTFRKWWQKARLLLWGQSLTEIPYQKVISGPKVRPFWQAIMGDMDAVVVDRWIVRLAYPDDRGYPARIRRIQTAIREIAPSVGVSPRDLQAALWVSVRGE